jgi:membrane protein
MIRKILIFISGLPLVRGILLYSHRHSLPGFEGLSFYEVARSFIFGVTESSLIDRAAAMTFKFFMAIFPSLLFVFTLIPLIPIDGLQDNILQTYDELMPDQVSKLMRSAVRGVVKKSDAGLLSVSFLAALFFSSNGIMGMIKGMNSSAHIHDSRPAGKQRLIALLLLLLIVLMTVGSVVILIFSSTLLKKYIHHTSVTTIIEVFRFLTVYTIVFITVSSIYYLAPAKILRKRFISPGAIVATNASIVASYILAEFFRNFDSYNKIYGTIGSFPVLMLWIFINCLVLLVGFELNVSIRAGRIKQSHKPL